MRSLLITGGAGFIGSNFVHYWLRRHPDDRVVALDALTYAGNPENLASARAAPGFRFVHGDIRDASLVEALLAEHAIDTVVHFAAETHVDRSIAGPDAFIETNVVGTHNLLKAAHRVWSAGARPGTTFRFHHVSTDEVYGALGENEAPCTEDAPYAPNSPYAASKAAADYLVRAYHRTYGLPVTISNCTNNYGPYHYPEKLIPLMLLNALTGRPLPVYGDGRQVRDWLHVEDHCRGIELVLERGRSGATYHLGGQCERTNLDIVRMLCSRLDEAFRQDPALTGRFPDCPAAQGKPVESRISHVADRPGHDRRYALDIRRAAQELGYRPEVQLDTGLSRTVQWYLDNEPWWRKAMDERYHDWITRQYDGR